MMYSKIGRSSLMRVFALVTVLGMVFGQFTTVFATELEETQPIVELVNSTIDVCSNIVGDQATIPEGMTSNDGVCTEIPPEVIVIDVCFNMEGDQATIPEGMTSNDGVCTEVIADAIDVCSNIEGDQATMPEGYAADGNACYPTTNEDPVRQCISDNLLQNASFEEPVVDGEWGLFGAVTGWTISSDALELWRNFMGGAAGGDQNAELDGNVPTTISQAVPTVVGNKYQISFWFSPRITRNEADNAVEASFGGSVLGTVSADGSSNETNIWTEHNFVVTADDVSSLLELKDVGTPNSYGTLIDAVSVCLVEDNSEVPTQRIDGYKFNDADGDGVWDEGEVTIAGWGIELASSSEEDENVLSTSTDANGYYYFDVPYGSYVVSEIGQKGWNHTATIGSGADGDMCYYTFGVVVNEESRLSREDSSSCTFGNQEIEEEDNQCKISGNLLANGSFETPVLDSEGPGWGVFASVINGLQWAVTWINPNESAPEVALLELQNGRAASLGDQYAELDSNYTEPGEVQIPGDARVKIAQTIATVPGEEYTLTYDFSAIPGHGRPVNNKVNVVINGLVVDTQTTSLVPGATTTNWTNQSFVFTASSSETEVALADAGKANTFGTLIDNVSLTGCLTEDEEIEEEGGGSNGGSSSGSRKKGRVQGDSTSTPTGEVLGAATDAMPAGAPNTGAGGAASVSVSLPVLNAILASKVTISKTK